VVEVVEHLDPSRPRQLRRVLFSQARPRTVVMTTPNAEYNVRFETLPPASSVTATPVRVDSFLSSRPGQRRQPQPTDNRVDLSGIGEEDSESGFSDADGGLQQVKPLKIPELCLVCPCRNHRFGQVDLRLAPLLKDRDPVVGLLSRPRLRRRDETPDGDGCGFRDPALHRRQAP